MAFPELDHFCRELHFLLKCREERARAALDVDDETGEVFCQLLAHDARCDQRNHFHRRRRVAQRIHLPIGRHDLVALTEHRAANSRHLPLRFVERQRRTKSGDRFQFVERTARVTEAAARHHRHRHAA